MENQFHAVFNDKINGSQIKAIIDAFENNNINLTKNRDSLLTEIKKKIEKLPTKNTTNSSELNNELHNRLVDLGNMCFNGYMYSNPISYVPTKDIIYFQNQIKEENQAIDKEKQCSYVNFSLKENNYRIDILSCLI